MAVGVNVYNKSSNNTINRSMSFTKDKITTIEIDDGQQAKEQRLDILGIPLHSMSKPYQFIVCCSGVLVFYLFYGYVQVRCFYTNVY